MSKKSKVWVVGGAVSGPVGVTQLFNEEIGQAVKELYLLALEGTQSQTYFESEAFNKRVERLYINYIKAYGKLPKRPPNIRPAPKIKKRVLKWFHGNV